MPIVRSKHAFTAGEISDWLGYRTNNPRFKNGCRLLQNAMAKPQGPALRRGGFRYIADIKTLMNQAIAGVDRPRLVPFIFNEAQAYVLCFYKHSSGTVRVAFGNGNGLVEDSASPGNPYIYEITGTFDHLNFAYAQSADILYIAQEGREPLEFIRNDHDSWTLQVATLTSAPTDWVGPDDYPQRVSFYEQRIMYGRINSRPQTIWASKSGDFYDFGVSSPLVDSDAVTVTLASGKQNKIQWMIPVRSFLIGTIGDEWSLQGSNGSPFTFASIDIDPHTNHGSESIPPLKIGTTLVFVEYLGRTINMLHYDYAVDNYQVTDLSILSPHLTLAKNITDWTYQRIPNSVIWAVRSDGKLLGLTFQKEHDIAGWHQHSTTGSFRSVTSIPGSTEHEVWTIAERNINGTDTWYLEKMAPEFTDETDATNGCFLDSYAIYDGVATSTITGLDHLEGEEVSILADGKVHPKLTVSSGSITLNFDAEYVIVGLSYTSIIEPRFLDPSDQDTVKGLSQTMVEVEIEFVDTLGGKIKYFTSDAEYEEEILFRNPEDITGDPLPLFNGFKRKKPARGWSRDPRLQIIQEDPLPMTVVGITDFLEVAEP